MRAWLKFAIVCFLALALPVQGVAGATMLHCGPNHERAPLAQDLVQKVSTSTAHHEHGAASHHTMGHGDKSGGDTASDASGLVSHGEHKCSSCASCFVGLALLCEMPRLASPELAATVFTVAPPSVEPYATDGPDRPPRPLLA